LGREIDREKIKLVIDVLKQKRATWSEIVTQTGIAERSVTRILHKYLNYWGLASKDAQGNWAWHDTIRTTASQIELDLDVDHSKWLTKGLDLYISSLSNPELKPQQPKGLRANGDSLLLACIEDHLKSGYPQLYANIESLRLILAECVEFMVSKYPQCQVDNSALELIENLDNYTYAKNAVPKQYRKLVEEIASRLTPEDFAKIRDLEKQKTLLIQEVSHAIQVLSIRVQNNQPLEGKCNICPNIQQNKLP
jgi:hypothetical protein